MIPFNKPYLTGKEAHYLYQAVLSGKISGNGIFTHRCHDFFEEKYGFGKVLLTTSGTDALEMAALLIDTQPGDEVIMPSFTFVSTANAFILRGARIVFADSEEKTPNLDIKKIEGLITKKTKAIVPVHYAGVACDMAPLAELANQYNLFVIEDAAHGIDSYYQGQPLGSIGHLGTFSFHETKNVISGEGGMLVINDQRFGRRAEIIWEKGTNRAEFFRGEANKYGWVDIGSSFLPSDIIAAFLYAQLENLEDIQKKRRKIWEHYYMGLKPLEEKKLLRLPHIPGYATNNAHIFYIITKNAGQRDQLLSFLNENGINAVFHYLSLHKSPFYRDKHDGRELPGCDFYSDCLIRLPFYYELSVHQIDFIIKKINEFYNLHHPSST
jgi:dTDP-4-amino-4,6-dideoxygalactose transaminase